jgi:cell division protein FtsI (penicillin-binding protein 3)
MTRDLAAGTFRLAVPLPRLVVVLGVVGLLLLAIVGRVGWMVTHEREFLQRQGEQRFERLVEVPAARGRLLDRRGVILADSVMTQAIWVDPLRLKEASVEQLEQLAKLLGMTPEQLESSIKSGGRRFAYLKRQAPVELAEAVSARKIPGVGLLPDPRRVYPHRSVVANVIGLTDLDGNGIEGVERGFDALLRGRRGRLVVTQDRQGRPVQEGEWLEAPQPGKDIVLALDLRLQTIALQAVTAAVAEHRAKAGTAVVIDVKTGEVLAMANVPTFDPEFRQNLDWAELRNRAITDSYEPGSVIKPILVALGLERGVVKPETRIDVRGGVIQVAGHAIHDAHASDRPLTVAEIVQKSSNVGVVKIAQMLPAEAVVSHYRRFGFGVRPELPFPGATGGRIFSAKSIKPIELATMAYGHGMSASLLQVASAYQALAYDGCRLPLSFVRVESPPVCRESDQVVSQATARAVQKMLASVTEEGGTGLKARVVGYSTAGKTGTARKLENGVYVHKYVASFVGYAPASNPRLVVAVMIDEPQGKAYYGGSVAAPVFAEIVRQALPAIGVLPDQPVPFLAERRPPQS